MRDTGIGIGRDYLARLTRSFTRENCGLTRGYEGCGLGLTLARLFLEQNGATLHVESEKGCGSTFLIRFA